MSTQVKSAVEKALPLFVLFNAVSDPCRAAGEIELLKAVEDVALEPIRAIPDRGARDIAARRLNRISQRVAMPFHRAPSSLMFWTAIAFMQQLIEAGQYDLPGDDTRAGQVIYRLRAEFSCDFDRVREAAKSMTRVLRRIADEEGVYDAIGL